MQIEILTLSEVSQKEKDKCHVIDLKYDTNEPIYKTNRLTERTDLWLPRRGLGEGRLGNLRLADTKYYIQNG